MSAAVVVKGLRKSYGSTVALDGLDLEIASGSLTGFLGPNGAGKTTTFRALLGLTSPDSGSMEVLGMRVGPQTEDIVRRVGAIVDEPGLIRGLNGRDNLMVAAHTLGRGHERIDSLLSFVGLSDSAHRRIDGYSKGMRQRLALAAALLGEPDLLFLDEPLDGLDPAGQAQMKQQLRELTAAGKTVVVSSHNLADVEALADYVIVINHGKLVRSAPLAELLDSRKGGYRVSVDDPMGAATALRAAGLATSLDDGQLRVDSDDGRIIARILAQAGIYPSELIREAARLEQIFLELTGEA
jgi:ABC-2 type transport system ATP-binding protein